MKTTLDLPDELITEVKIEAAKQKKKLNQLVPELISAGLSARRQRRPLNRRLVEKWIDDWVQLGQAATADLPPGPTATEILAEDRGRLERH